MECNDGFFYPSPVGSYAANAFGLHDTIGNVRERTADCWNESYAGAPTNGSTWTTGTCAVRIIRGGSWLLDPSFLRVSGRQWSGSAFRSDELGFRLAQDL